MQPRVMLENMIWSRTSSDKVTEMGIDKTLGQERWRPWF